MTLAHDDTSTRFERYFTASGVHPFDTVQWHRVEARIENPGTGAVVFSQPDVEFPTSWSATAVNIVSQKYFRGGLGTPERETSLRQVIGRVVDTITEWGRAGDYFADDADAETFAAELTYLLLHQRAAFNSPVWFNIGVEGVPAQSSACFILSVDDTMDSILNWYVEEGKIFKGGSGAGCNLSRIRSSRETLGGGGHPSGPVSFMRGADASAGTIKSGGKTRRAAKMVILDVDHPDVEDFIWCKAREERKARALRDAGFDVDLDGADSHSIQYQNANNSVRVTDEFMKAVVDGDHFDLLARTTGEVTESVPAADLFRQIAQASWECADPGVQFDTTINRWHTTPTAGRISASNPCSEYMHLDNSACNLASLNLLSFLDDDNHFDVEAFRAAVGVVIAAQEILVSRSHYPTEAIAANARAFRQLGIGYANLGALLMSLGMPYDSDEGRALAAAITATMTGQAYLTSARLAARLGPFDGYAADSDATLRVLRMHRGVLEGIDAGHVPADLLEAAREVWDQACEAASECGVRNAQVSVLAPTGTISFMMDCDTTGIEPDLALIKSKKLVGGGTISIVNHSVRRALETLGYGPAEVAAIVAHVDAHGTVLGAPHLSADDVAVFACSMGDNVIGAYGHIAMMGAVQPFLSGAISKTVNLPESASVDDVEGLLLESWRLGLKAVAVYRDNCKVGQPLSASGGSSTAAPADVAAAVTSVAAAPVRRRLPRARASRTFEFRVADCKGYVTVGEYDDGRPGEIFVRVSKQGSTLAGIMDAFAIAVSHGLQYGVSLDAYVRAFVGMRFEPAGMTDDPDIRIAASIVDYLFRRLALEYLSVEERAELHIFSTDERLQPTLPGVEESTTQTSQGLDLAPDPPSDRGSVRDPGHVAPASASTTAPSGAVDANSPLCMSCGGRMVRAGACYVCSGCGSTSGCS